MPNDHLPLYLQIAGKIKNEIDSEDFSVGDKLPFESWYVEHFGVSRVTVRKAIDELIREGVVERRPYRGLYVSQKKLKIIQANSPIYSFESLEDNCMVTSKILTFDVVPATDKLANIFSCQREAGLYHLNVLRLNREVPITLQTLYLSKELLPDLDIFLLRDYPLYEVVEKFYHMSISHVNVSMTVALPSEEQAGLLGATADDSLLKATDTLFLDNDRVVRYATSLYAKSVNYNYTLYK